MPLFKLRIEVPGIELGRAACDVIEGLGEPAPLAVTLFELRPPAFVVEAYYDAAPTLDDVKLHLAERDSRLADATLEEVPDQNWVALSQAALPPIAAGRFIVHGGHDRARFRLRRLAVEIEAGEAFGSGHNATTALCLEALDALARRRQPLRRVLDLGCGSGVLAIAAARVAPAARVLAVDNDPVAVAIARDNVRLNRVSDRVRVLHAGGLNHPMLRHARPFDLVLANILPGPLIALAPALRHAIRRGGAAILSGLLDDQGPEVAAAYRANGFRRQRRLQRAGWTALVVVNSDGAADVLRRMGSDPVGLTPWHDPRLEQAHLL
jgi:ribosomal protein L11 methyltransferase